MTFVTGSGISIDACIFVCACVCTWHACMQACVCEREEGEGEPVTIETFEILDLTLLPGKI